MKKNEKSLSNVPFLMTQFDRLEVTLSGRQDLKIQLLTNLSPALSKPLSGTAMDHV